MKKIYCYSKFALFIISFSFLSQSLVIIYNNNIIKNIDKITERKYNREKVNIIKITKRKYNRDKRNNIYVIVVVE